MVCTVPDELSSRIHGTSFTLLCLGTQSPSFWGGKTRTLDQTTQTLSLRVLRDPLDSLAVSILELIIWAILFALWVTPSSAFISPRASSAPLLFTFSPQGSH